MSRKSESPSFLKATILLLLWVSFFILLLLIIGIFYINIKQSSKNILTLSNNLGQSVEIKSVNLCGELILSNFILYQNDSFSVALENSQCSLIVEFFLNDITYRQEFYVSSITQRKLLISLPPYQGVKVTQ